MEVSNVPHLFTGNVTSQSVNICNKSGDPGNLFMPIIPTGSEAFLVRPVFASLACYLQAKIDNVHPGDKF